MTTKELKQFTRKTRLGMIKEILDESALVKLQSRAIFDLNDEEVNMMLAENQFIDIDLIKDLSETDSVDTKLNLIENKITPIEIIEKLAKDESLLVSENALEKLEKN